MFVSGPLVGVLVKSVPWDAVLAEKPLSSPILSVKYFKRKEATVMISLCAARSAGSLPLCALVRKHEGGCLTPYIVST